MNIEERKKRKKSEKNEKDRAIDLVPNRADLDLAQEEGRNDQLRGPDRKIGKRRKKTKEIAAKTRM